MNNDTPAWAKDANTEKKLNNIYKCIRSAFQNSMDTLKNTRLKASRGYKQPVFLVVSLDFFLISALLTAAETAKPCRRTRGLSHLHDLFCRSGGRSPGRGTSCHPCVFGCEGPFFCMFFFGGGGWMYTIYIVCLYINEMYKVSST